MKTLFLTLMLLAVLGAQSTLSWAACPEGQHSLDQEGVATCVVNEAAPAPATTNIGKGLIKDMKKANETLLQSLDQ